MTIYLDNHSTTRLDPRVLEAMLPWLTEHYGNAGSVTHEMGREARAAVDSARDTLAAAIGGTPREIVFTSGATESNNLAILGFAARATDDRRHVVTVVTEHHAVLDPIEHLERTGFAVTRLAVEPGTGRVGPDAVAAALRCQNVIPPSARGGAARCGAVARGAARGWARRRCGGAALAALPAAV